MKYFNDNLPSAIKTTLIDALEGAWCVSKSPLLDLLLWDITYASAQHTQAAESAIDFTIGASDADLIEEY